MTLLDDIRRTYWKHYRRARREAEYTTDMDEVYEAIERTLEALHTWTALDSTCSLGAEEVQWLYDRAARSEEATISLDSVTGYAAADGGFSWAHCPIYGSSRKLSDYLGRGSHAV